jgi:hypothetical protein
MIAQDTLLVITLQCSCCPHRSGVHDYSTDRGDTIDP